MSKTRSIGCYGAPPPDHPDPRREIWAYDGALAILLAQLLRDVEGIPPDHRPPWWDSRVEELRTQAMFSDLFFDVALGLEPGQREELAELFEDSADRLAERQPRTPGQVDDWHLVFRGDHAYDVGPIAELGRALGELLRGTLPAPPPGTLWLYGTPGGRTTISPR
ncbi:hypothetical protein ACWT_4440 [Actinoplanes sp. SE50]|uniref:hypothetical protein n=1 Tax=unclassified Actinoplanes TaxID=2626549 RepID=UPI00023ECCFB|nr:MULTISPECIES: hypothetical protein [unclassified Actinoplanes]AEV85462.1 hypothetical protein ACPL_4571 [Actinoplanes sp. SE50/110]ATO83855.1 hypothetical protein ACWT_4440 [Actinoplanes sp. SE50]SLM01265.1 hypothetical protein ACSP50_4501 [Actinoplanes sp. SE50/110]